MSTFTLVVFVFFCVGKEIALFVNNLGGTSNLELSIIAKEALTYLGKHNITLYTYLRMS